MKEPTGEQIKAEIAELKRIKPLIPERSFFGDNNQEAIDAQIIVLEEDLSEEDVFERGERAEDEEGYFDENMINHARDAVDWLNGDSEESPSAGWAVLVKK